MLCPPSPVPVQRARTAPCPDDPSDRPPRVITLHRRVNFDIDTQPTSQGSSSGPSIQDFKLQALLGHGGSAKVYLAKYLVDGKIYALKTIPKARLSTEGLGQVMAERALLAKCNHPLIIRLYSAFQDNLYFYFCLEYLPGDTLTHSIHKQGKLSMEVCRHIAAQVVVALQYLHSLNIIHRDIKPDNILLDDKGHARVSDLGLSKIANGKTYSVCGTRSYLAPEQLTKGGHDRMVDYWALGCLVYEMVTGEQPFYHSKQQELFTAIRNVYLS